MIRRATPYGELSTQSLSDYLATLGLFLTLCIAGMITFVSIRVIHAYFPGAPQAAFWMLGVAIVVGAYFAYGQIKLAPWLMPALFVGMLWLCREIVTKPATGSHSRHLANHSSERHTH